MSRPKSSTQYLPTDANIEQFEMLFPMLESDLTEMRELSKKKQDGLINTLKAKAINKKLEKIKAILAQEPTVEFLEILDEDTLPTNSDAVMIIAQFVTAMKQFRRKYTGSDTKYGSIRWFTQENPRRPFSEN